MKKKKSGGVLFTSARHQRNLERDQGFSDPTFSSVKRQQPLQVYTPSRRLNPTCCTPHRHGNILCQGTPQSCHLHLTPADFGYPKKKKKAAAKQKKVITKSPKVAKKTMKKASQKQPRKGKRSKVVSDAQESPHITNLVDKLCSEPDMSRADLSSAIADQANQLQELRREISQKLAELKGGFDRDQAATGMAGPEAREQVQTRSSQMQSEVFREPPATQLPSALPSDMLPSFSDPRLPSVLRRLEELEVEEDAIRQRWRTIAYEDPLVTTPFGISHQKGGGKEEGGKKPRQESEVANAMPPLSYESILSIEEYRHSYSRHLACSKPSSQGVDWKTAERYTSCYSRNQARDLMFSPTQHC